MKKLSVIFMFMCFYAFANAQIPNFNFENWTNGTNAAPDGWSDYGSNHAGFYPVMQSADAYQGSFAARIENKIDATDTTYGEMFTTRPNYPGGGFNPAFPANQRYNTLKGFYKYSPENGDSAQIIVILFKTGYNGPWGNVLAWGQKNLGMASTYIPFSVGYLDSLETFIYIDNILFPDSGDISFYAYKPIDEPIYNNPPKGNSVLLIDAINFDTYLTANNMDITTDFTLYPNASNGNFEVNFNTSENDYTTIKVFDVNAREVLNLFSGNLDMGSHALHYNLSNLNNGNYIFVVSSSKGYRAEKICIQK